MRIPKSLLIQPSRNTAYGATAIAISIFVFAYSSIFGQKAILLYYLVWLPLVLVDYRFTLHRLVRSPVVIAFVLLACLSVFWSAAPGTTARASVQYFSQVVCAFIAARTVDARTLSIGALAGITLVLLYSVAAPHHVYDPFDGVYTFVGAFASKNQLGFFASLGMFFAFFYAFFLAKSGTARITAALLFIFSAAVLLMSRSATSLIATPVAIMSVVMIAGLQVFQPRHRRVFLSICVLLGVLTVFAALNLGLFDAILGAFGKDSTLTGRTYLWSEGLKFAGDAPFLGMGYQAFWVQGFSEAERLWVEFYISSRSGFHFHNTYIESLVGLGYVGTVLIILIFLSTASRCIRILVRQERNVEATLVSGLLVLLMIRSFFEVDILYPYQIGSFLFFYCYARSCELMQAMPRPKAGLVTSDFDFVAPPDLGGRGAVMRS